MTEEKCRELIKKDLQEMTVLCSELLNCLDEISLDDIDYQLGRIVGKYGLAKKRLLECEEY